MNAPWDLVLNWLLPRACAHCRGDLKRGDGPLCASCEALLPGPLESACVRCAGRREGASPYCTDCSGRVFSCRLIRAATAHRGPAASLVHAFKFRGIAEAARRAGSIMARDLAVRPELAGFDALAPVPIHAYRACERGYNQAEVIARELAAKTGLPLLDVLRRPRGLLPSWRLSRSQRRAELAEAFTAAPKASWHVLGKRVMIIDDVAATGTTLEACAAALRAAGAADAAGYVFSRSPT